MYRTILVPTDGSEASTTAASHALDMAAACGATVHVLYVVDVRMSPLTADVGRGDVDDLLEQSEESPTEATRHRAEQRDIPVTDAIRVGVPYETIRDYVAAEGVDLIVVGTHGWTGLEHTLLGSVTERVVRTADVPVLTVRGDQG